MTAGAEDEDPLVGTLVLGRYRVVQPLARGGMGMIYLARLEGAAGFSKPVVIKQVLSHLDGYEEARSQFIREARILSELHHPGIVGVLDFGEEANAYVMALEYVHGFHLGQWLRYTKGRGKQINWEHAAYVTLRVLEAVQYAHTRVDQDGTPRVIIHRDISPGNILIDLQGNVRLLDFGIARAVGDKGEHQTRDGVVKGKLSYIAPEIYGSVEANPSTDVYAVGLVLYQLLAGKNPYVGKDMSDTIGRVLMGKAPPLSSVRSDISRELSDVVASAIAKNRELRFATADEFAAQLSGALGRSQSEIAADFRLAVGTDFSESLPKALGVLPLSALDAAWRRSGPDPEAEQSLLQSSLPPTTDETSAPVLVPPNPPVDSDLTVVTRPLNVLPTPPGGTEVTGALSQTIETDTVTTAQAVAALTEAALKNKSANSRTIVLSMIGASVIAASIAALVLTFTAAKNSPPKEQRYLLVERPDAKAPTISQEPLADALPKDALPTDGSSQAPSASPPVTGEHKVPTPAQRKSQKTGVSELTQAFSRRASSVQGCFSKNAGALQGSPQISIRFEVSAAGAVNSASLSPTALAGTSVGQCLLGVARSTKFPAGEKSVAFSIPITARVVNN